MYLASIATAVTSARRINIDQRLPVNVGKIVGLAVQVDGVDETNTTLITLSNSSDLFLTVKRGVDTPIQAMRLSDLVFLPDPDGTSALTFGEKRFFRMDLPNTIELDKSFYDNPTGIASGRILLQIWYLPR